MASPVPAQLDPAFTNATYESLKLSPDQKIHLPQPLLGNLPEAAKTLLKIDTENKKVVAFAESFPGFHPGDVGVCFMRLIRSTFGFVSLEGMPTFFGKKPPMLYNIRTGPRPEDIEPMVFGDIEIPGMGDSVKMSIQIDFNTKMPTLMIRGQCENRHLSAVNGVLAQLKRDLPQTSIYRGKAIRVSWQWKRDGDDYSISEHSPLFLDLTKSNYNNIVLTDEATRQVAANLFLPIIHGDRWTEMGFSRKTGVLMQGPPGCGKTETLLKVANLCVDHRRTYIQCGSVEDLELAAHMALNYTPCVVAVEDVDKAASGDRDVEIDKLLNIIDGTEIKGRDILFVATTNDVASITEAMLRPGRLGDGFIYMGPPDAAACERLVRITASTSLRASEDISEACAAMDGSLPAVIVATVQSARKYALVRSGMGSDTITNEDLLASFAERKRQIELLTPKPEDERSDMEKAAEVLGAGLAASVDRFISGATQGDRLLPTNDE